MKVGYEYDEKLGLYIRIINKHDIAAFGEESRREAVLQNSVLRVEVFGVGHPYC